MCFICTGCGKCKGESGAVRFFPCPSCAKPIQSGEMQCSSCGIEIAWTPDGPILPPPSPDELSEREGEGLMGES